MEADNTHDTANADTANADTANADTANADTDLRPGDRSTPDPGTPDPSPPESPAVADGLDLTGVPDLTAADEARVRELYDEVMTVAPEAREDQPGFAVLQVWEQGEGPGAWAAEAAIEYVLMHTADEQYREQQAAGRLVLPPVWLIDQTDAWFRDLLAAWPALPPAVAPAREVGPPERDS